MATPINPEPQKEKESKIVDKTKASFVSNAVEMAKSNIGDTIAYIVLLSGLILLFFHPFYGGLPVGLIMGLYFSKKVFIYTAQFREFIAHEGIFNGFIIVASVAALVISAPGLCLGMFIGAIARPLFGKALSPEE